MAPTPAVLVTLLIVAAAMAIPAPEPGRILGGLGRAVGGVGRGVGSVVGGVGRGVGTIVEGVASGRPISGVVGGVSEALSGVGSGVASTLEGVGRGVADVAGGIGEVAGDVIGGVANGLDGDALGGGRAYDTPSTRESLASAAQSLQAIASQGPSQPQIVIQQMQQADVQE